VNHRRWGHGGPASRGLTTTPSAALIPVVPVFTNTERLALAGFLAGYSGLTRQAYELDLRQYASWYHQHHLRLFQARRADIECFARDLEARGRARATITRRLCTIAGFYRYAVEEDLLEHSPAAHVRRPRLDYESHATGLDRNELGALLVAAGLGSPGEHALVSLLALNGLRVLKPPAPTSRTWASSAGTGLWWSSARAARWSPSRSHRGRRVRSTWPSVRA
jgi:integrase